MRRSTHLLLAALTLAALAPAASAAPVARRGLEATELSGSAKRLEDPAAPDGEVIALGRGTPSRAAPRLLATKSIELTLAGGCDARASLTVRIDGTRPHTVAAAPSRWHVRSLVWQIAPGRHVVRIFASWPRRDRRRCARPKLDRVDFMPQSPSDYVLLGAAVRATNLVNDPAYRELFTSRFDSLTPENEMKMQYAEPLPGYFVFKPADTLVDYAAAHAKQVRGHTLVYGDQIPGWVAHPLLPWSSSQLLGVMTRYIDTMMHRYGSRVVTWDVVNEAIAPSGRYYHNVWYRTIGPGYIADAFRAARAADPGAELFYNDQFSPVGPQANSITNMVRDFRRRGVPIDGIGVQNHVSLARYPPERVLERSLAGFAALGLRVEITEMDVRTLSLLVPYAQREQAEAKVYRRDATACWDIAACHRFTTWGVYDGLSWIGSAQAPLLFDVRYQPKPAYFAVAQALHLNPS